ncbi:hypothetical protein GCM10025771_08800 [Niveibacterium umoris]|uniref:GNAT superfamily N-acetyltransferase n=1 Tax=Niveibacterium umoris TaxID=1193620 RepID=A0A840BJ47_9RHOO|nr:GNAT family N-acetyltransferase [Niveibacterium umoris]MBB4013571.1 GNAT superfamily N-acetyltransferase [Niveibacterium umoris]
MQLRDLDPFNADEIALVAQRMRDTLVEVEGAERGAAMYTMAWLENRVRWHLDPANTRARVVLALADGDTVAGHTIFRIEHDASGMFGLISTTYVLPAFRRHGVAQALLECAEAWFRAQGVPQCCTWTSSTNRPLIGLYARNGYSEAERGPNDLTGTMMVRLAKGLTTS